MPFGKDVLSDPSARASGSIRVRTGGFYDGDYTSLELTSNVRAGSRFTGGVGWTRQNVSLKYGDFHTDLVPLKVSYSFTTLASIQALVQYNNQSSLLSSNVRLALLNRSGTGLFVVQRPPRYEQPRPARDSGRSFIVKYTRLVDF